MGEKNPKVLVFDLDYTLWPFYCDCLYNLPVKKSPSGDVVDSSGSKMCSFPDVTKVLSNLHSRGYVLAVASRTSEIEGANQLVKAFGWDNFFTFMQIFPGSKVEHLTNIKEHYKVEFSDIIFFDDEDRNIREVSKLGVLSIFVRNGVTRELVKKALEEFAKRP